MLLNLIRTLFTTIVPLAIFKYVSVVLTKDGLGKVSYSNSIVQYALLIAGLGVSRYATRECAKCREYKDKTSTLASEVFTINIISTIVAYFVLLCIVINTNSLNEYKHLIIIQSISIFFTTIGVEWISVVFEDFLSITIRTVIVQIISFVLTVIFVREPSDINKYVVIIVMAIAITSITNYVYIKKYVSLRIVFSRALFKHIRPILIISFVNIAVSIYVNSDLTILGFFRSDAEVGSYSVAVKIYTACKTILASVIAVTVPRLSNYFETNKREYYRNLQNIFSVTLLIVIPLAIGVFLMPELFISIISNVNYYDAAVAVKILIVSLIPTMLSTIINSNILIAQRKESKLLFSTSIASALNISLNIMLIPIMGMVAAATTTLLAEGVVLLICIFQGHNTLKMMNLKILLTDLIKILIGCAFILLLYCLINLTLGINLYSKIVFMMLSIIGYFVIEIVIRNNGVLYLVSTKTPQNIR